MGEEEGKGGEEKRMCLLKVVRGLGHNKLVRAICGRTWQHRLAAFQVAVHASCFDVHSSSSSFQSIHTQSPHKLHSYFFSILYPCSLYPAQICSELKIIFLKKERK